MTIRANRAAHRDPQYPGRQEAFDPTWDIPSVANVTPEQRERLMAADTAGMPEAAAFHSFKGRTQYKAHDAYLRAMG